MPFLATKIISAMLLPPMNILILSGIGLLLLKRRPRLGRNILIVSWLLLYTLSTSMVSRALVQSVESIPPLRPETLSSNTDVDAIVVLSGGQYCDAPEYGEDSPDGGVLERMRYGAFLHRKTHKPVFVTGGKPSEAGTLAAGVVMQRSLQNDFHIPVLGAETQSTTTWENAAFSAPLLREHGVQKIYLVTHAVHMPRSVKVFEQAGLQVVPAPTRFATSCKTDIRDFLPRSSSLSASNYALYEWIGRAWYWVRHTLLSDASHRAG